MRVTSGVVYAVMNYCLGSSSANTTLGIRASGQGLLLSVMLRDILLLRAFCMVYGSACCFLGARDVQVQFTISTERPSDQPPSSRAGGDSVRALPG